MSSRCFAAAFVALALAPAAHAQGIAIQHDPVGCVVAGKYPQLRACFDPASDLARARAYFRASGAGADWYYVEMKSDSPCHAGVLPKPKKALIGQTIEYYLDAASRSLSEARTEEVTVLVVENEAECKAKFPVAPILNSAKVAVFPSLPAGFAGGGLGATAAVVGGGLAAAGGTTAVVVATKDDEPTTTTTLAPVSPTTTTTLSPAPPTTTTTTTTPVAFKPVFKVLRDGVAVGPGRVSAIDHVTLSFDMCDSAGPYPMNFDVWVDGVKMTAGCYSTISFTVNGAFTGGGARSASRVRASEVIRSFEVSMRLRSQAPNNEPKAEQQVIVDLETPPTTTTTTDFCLGDTEPPDVSITSPQWETSYPFGQPYPVSIAATASDGAGVGVDRVEFWVQGETLGPDRIATISSSPYAFDWSQAAVEAWLGTTCQDWVTISARAYDQCGNESAQTQSNEVGVFVLSLSPLCGPSPSMPPGPSANPQASQGPATLVSELQVPGGSGQLVVAGDAVFPRAGRTPVTVRARSGVVRVEATLIEARGAGTWRFELDAIPGVQADSVRVVAGEVIQTGGGVLTFRLRGRPGERIVFSFDAR